MTITVYEELEQGSQAWLDARAGIITASAIGKLVSPRRLQAADNETSRRYIRELAVERITGQPTEQAETYDMRRGTMAEPIARAHYEESFNPVHEVGFIRQDFPGFSLGVSPDGLIGDKLMLEIKSPKASTHFQTLLNDQVPDWNLAQVHAAMLIADYEAIDFVSFFPSMPLFVKRVHRSDVWDKALIDAAAQAEEQIEELIAAYQSASEGRPATPWVDVMESEGDIVL